MPPDYVVEDRNQTNIDILTAPVPGVVQPPVVTNLLSGLAQSPREFGGGIVKYSTNGGVGSTTTYFPFSVPRPHILLRIEIEQKTSANVPDNSLLVSLQRAEGTNNYDTTAPTLFANSTPGNTVVFIGSDDEYATDNCTYILAFTGTDTDTIFVHLYVKYL